MKISYYLNEGRKKNLYCRISDGLERITFSLEYEVNPKKWNSKKEEIDSENEYYFVLMDFKKYLEKKYYEFQSEGKDRILERLKNEAFAFTKDSGLEGIAGAMFDYFNKENNLPKYADFVRAFEKFSKLKKGEYKVETLGEVIHFHTSDKVYEMNTYESQISLLKSYIEKRSYDEIFTETNINAWSEIYLDGGFGGTIEKSEFIPKMLSEWERYWYNQYQEIRETGDKTNHLDVMKQQSWRQFQIFMECYNDSPDIIRLAYNINDIEIYPIAVITMMQIFDAETCYGEYCEFEFEEINDWQSIDLNEEDADSPIFYVREYEF
jgi:hypothetical protein